VDRGAHCETSIVRDHRYASAYQAADPRARHSSAAKRRLVGMDLTDPAIDFVALSGRRGAGDLRTMRRCTDPARRGRSRARRIRTIVDRVRDRFRSGRVATSKVSINDEVDEVDAMSKRNAARMG
jgi:hypothetical protein